MCIGSRYALPPRVRTENSSQTITVPISEAAGYMGRQPFFVEGEQRSFFQDLFASAGSFGRRRRSHLGERNKKWRSVEAYGRFWSMGSLPTIAAARRAKKPSERLPAGSYEIGPRTSPGNLSRRLMRAARSLTNLVRRHRSIPTRGRRSKSRTTSRFPRNCAERRSTGRGRHATWCRGKFLGRGGKTFFGASMRA